MFANQGIPIMKPEVLSKISSIINSKDHLIESIAIIIFTTGLILNYTIETNSSYFIIIGGCMLVLLYILRFYISDKLIKGHTPGDVFTDKLVNGALALTVLGIVLLLTGSTAEVIVFLGLTNLLLSLVLMIYFRIKNQSRYPWPWRYIYRIIVFAGIGIYLVM